jgi:hypothetical protein
MRSAEYPREWEFRTNEFGQGQYLQGYRKILQRRRPPPTLGSVDAFGGQGVPRAVLFHVRGKYAGHRKVLR